MRATFNRAPISAGAFLVCLLAATSAYPQDNSRAEGLDRHAQLLDFHAWRESCRERANAFASHLAPPPDLLLRRNEGEEPGSVSERPEENCGTHDDFRPYLPAPSIAR